MERQSSPKCYSGFPSLIGLLLALLLLAPLGISNHYATICTSKGSNTIIDSHATLSSTVTGRVNTSNTGWTATYEITTPGLYKLRVTVKGIYNPYSSHIYIQLGGSQKVYMPPLDANTSSDCSLGYMLFNPVTGDTEESTTHLLFFRTGIFTVHATLLPLLYYYPGTTFRIDVSLSLEIDLSDAEKLDLGENNLYWTTPSTPKYYCLDVSEEAFYNVTVVWELDYNTTSSRFEDLAYPSLIYDVTHGTYRTWQHIRLDEWIPSGTGTVSGSETYIFPLVPQRYIWYLHVANFTQWGGTFIKVDVSLTKINAQVITSGSPGSFTVTSDNSVSWAFLEVNPLTLYSLELNRVTGYNWSINSDFGLKLQYQRNDSTTSIHKTSLHEFHAYQVNPTPLASISGIPPSHTSWRARLLHTVDGTAISASYDSGIIYHPTGRIPVMFTGTPLPGSSSSFEFSLSITEEAHIPILTPSSSSSSNRQTRRFLHDDEVPINTTIGPFYYLYRVMVRSGYQYQVTATASEYDRLGYSQVSLLPPSDYENWLSPYSILVSPWSEGSYIALNGTAGIEFVSPVTGEVFVIVYGVPPYPTPSYDTKELIVSLIEKPPLSYTPNTIMTATPNYYSTFTFTTQAGFAYLINLEIPTPHSAYAVATIFDGQGNSPFDISYQELFVISLTSISSSSFSSFSSLAFADYIGGYIAKETAVVTLMIWSDGEPVTFIVQEWRAEAAGFQIGFIFSHWIGIAITIPVTFTITFIILRRRRK